MAISYACIHAVQEISYVYTHTHKCSVVHYLNSYRCYNYLIQKHPGCKKGAAKNLKKGWDEKDLKSKWAAKAGVVLVLMRIKF